MSSGIQKKFTGYHHRRSIRLPGYDYSQPGYYFVTICIHDRKQNLFGNISVGDVSGGGVSGGSVVGAGSKPAPTAHVIPNQYHEIVQNTWNDLPNHIPNIVLDEFVIMPNHIHGIIRIVESVADRANWAGLEPAPTVATTVATVAPTVALPEIIRQLKTFSAKRINKLRNTVGQSVWQRNYYERIIRDEKSLFFIRKYIRKNPINWVNDSKNHIDREIIDLNLTETGDRK